MMRPRIRRERVIVIAGIAMTIAMVLASAQASPQSRRPEPAPQPQAEPAKPAEPAPSEEAPSAPTRRVVPQSQPAAAPAQPQNGAGGSGAGAPGAGAETPPPANGAAPRGSGAAGGTTVPPAAGTATPPPGGATAGPPDAPTADESAPTGTGVIAESRRPGPGGEKLVRVVASNAKVKEFIRFIAEVTGKSVIPRLGTAGDTAITVASDRWMTRKEALDLIFQAFRINNIAVVETERYVFIDMMSEVPRLGPHPVLGPEVDLSTLNEDGQWVFKYFKIQNTKADALVQRITELPEPVTITADPNSNQLQFFGDLATAKRVQRIVQLLDVPAYVDVQTKTFRLQWADASQVANYITELFTARGGSSGAGAAAQRGGAAQPRGGPQNRGGQQPSGGGELVGTSEQLLVSVIPAINSITVRAEPSVMHEIERLITTAWDVNPSGTGQIFKYYDLKYTDPLKVREVLGALRASGGGGGASRGGGGGRGLPGGVAGRQQVGGGGGEAGADVAVANIFRIEAYPDSNRLLVISKTPDNFDWLDKMIRDLDQPLRVVEPEVVALKHANAIEVAEILNALLAPAGSDAGIAAPETGLSGINFQTAGGGTTTTAGSSTTGGSTTGGGGNTNSGQITFPWQSSRGAGGEEQTEVSALVGKSRVVPNAGQNSLLVLAPPEIRESLMRIIADLDVPGRQVMITAILAEVQLGDQLAYGLQFGSSGLAPSNPRNAVVITGAAADTGRMYSGSREGDFIGDLTTSVLSFGVDATVILQALDEVTNVSILQSPRIFTSDNKEAIFFDGQDIPFQSQTSNQGTAGGTTASFEQIAVGIGLNVRPRITKERNVYMDIEVLLSNQNTTSPQGVGGNPVIDRRQTNTKVTVKNGQTIVISGIRKEQRNFQKSKVPFLGDIPGLDLIFAFTDDTTTTKELVVFITPVVVDNPEQNDSNFNVRERERLRELAQPLSERSDKLIRGAGFTPMKDKPADLQPLTPLEEPAPNQPLNLP